MYTMCNGFFPFQYSYNQRERALFEYPLGTLIMVLNHMINRLYHQ